MKAVRSVPEDLFKASEEDRKVTRLADQVISGSQDGLNRRARLGSSDTDYGRMEDFDEQGCTDFAAAACEAVRSKMPILQWLPKYDARSMLFYDITGGVTIALICLVQTLAHAAIATTRIIQGPYTAFMPPTIYALFGTSPHVSVASGAIVAILIADQLQTWPSEEDRTHLATLLSLMSGLMLLVMGLFRAAFMVRFLSQSTISGFVSGGAILIIEGQMKNWLGLTHLPHSIGFIHTTQILIEALPQTNINGLILGGVGIAFLEAAIRTKARLVKDLKGPGPHATWKNTVKICTEMKELILVFGSLLFAYVTCPAGGEPIVPVVGHIPAGLPPFRLPWKQPVCWNLITGTDVDVISRWHHFIAGSALVALTSFLTTYATSKKQAMAHGYAIEPEQEMLALGLAGVGGSFLGCFSPSGSLSRTALAAQVGVKSQLSGFMKILVIGSSLVFITPVLYYMPKAALAAVIIRSSWNLLDFPLARQLYARSTIGKGLQTRIRPFHQGGMVRDLVIWWIAFLLTLIRGVLYGIGAAVLVSLVLIIKDSVMPKVVSLGSIEQLGGIWRDAEVWGKMGKTLPGILVVEFRGPLSFASADHFQEELEKRRRAARTKVKMVVLSFGSVHELDATALTMLKDLLLLWRKDGVEAIVADAKSRVRLLLEEHFGSGDSHKYTKPLLWQPAFIISVTDAVRFAQRSLKTREAPAGKKGQVALDDEPFRKAATARFDQEASVPRFRAKEIHWGRRASAGT